MKIVLILMMSMFLGSCGADCFTKLECESGVPTDGENGVDGKDGTNGENGTNGVDGKDGTNGVDGKDGSQGPAGRDGMAGKDGKDGSDGTNGANGSNGNNGSDGKDGVDGQDGVNGADGQDAVILTVFSLPTYNLCVNVGDGYYAKNKGSKVSIYEDSGCTVIECNQLRYNGNESCWVEDRIQFSVEEDYSLMKLHKLTFAQ